MDLLTRGCRLQRRPMVSSTPKVETPSWAMKTLPDLPLIDFFGNESHDPSKECKKDSKKDSKKESSKRKRERSVSTPTIPKTPLFPNYEAVAQFRKQHHIHLYGDAPSVSHPIPTFHDLIAQHDMSPELLDRLVEAGYKEPTPVQMQLIPILLEKKHVMACAPTGSGKSLAFILPVMMALKAPSKDGLRALFVAPTRELAQQMYQVIQQLQPTKKPLKTAVLSKSHLTKSTFPMLDILITTPLRLLHALDQKRFDLQHLQFMVMDEADKLLDEGAEHALSSKSFLAQMDAILENLSSKTVKVLVSATMASGVERLASSFMGDAVRLVIGQKNAANVLIDQKLVFVGQEEGKLLAVRQMLHRGEMKPPVLVFVQSIERAKHLFQELVYDGIHVEVMHSDRTTAQRDQIIQQFRLGNIWVLIATDLMARGLDFIGIECVINYDFPQSVASYIHRIGRTGRAGRSGRAVTFFTKEDVIYLKLIVNVMKESGCPVPEWMLTLEAPDQETRKQLKKRAPLRPAIDTTPAVEKRALARKKQIKEQSKQKKQRLDNA